MPRHDTCIVFLSHFWDESVGRRFERLRRESAEHADCFLVLQDDDAQAVERWKAHLASIGAADCLFTFNSVELPKRLGIPYFGSQRVMTNTHFPMLLFAREHPGYAYHWQVEGDVEYRGNWGEFLAAYQPSDAALLAAHFHRWHDWPDWFWWPSLTAPADHTLAVESMYKAFLAVMRISRPALDAVERALRKGWMGHFEAVIPSVLLLEGFALEDLNVRKTAYIGWYQDPIPLLPLQSTVRCRPHVTMQEFASRGQGPLLFHPIKERWAYDGEKVVVFTK
jgi:hypothetical protein